MFVRKPIDFQTKLTSFFKASLPYGYMWSHSFKIFMKEEVQYESVHLLIAFISSKSANESNYAHNYLGKK